MATQDLLRISTAGSVDDGKSTLIGRLLYDTQSVYDDQLQSVSKASPKGLELAFLTDGLRAEREQGITIDVAYRYFSTKRRKFIIADTPGHEQYTRNMATGASTAQLALLLTDARKGLLPQTVRHAAIAWLLGIRQVVFAVNKMDLVDFSQDVFDRIRHDFEPLQKVMKGIDVYFVPVAALDGDNIVHRSRRIGWFHGPSILEYLEQVAVEQNLPEQPFRMPVQHVIRSDDFRAYAGQIASGTVALDQELVALPSGRRVRIASLPSWDGELKMATAPMSVALCLDDHSDLGRGDMLADVAHPPKAARSVQARLVWMSDVPLLMGRRYLIKHSTQTVWCEIASGISTLNMADLSEHPAKELRLNDIGMVTMRMRQPVFCDPYPVNRHTGSFIVIDPFTNLTLGAGMIQSVLDEKTTKSYLGSSEGMTVWFTGLSSAGKSTLSRAVYDRLWEHGYRVELLDGDEVRKHLSRGLGFSREDRSENLRRIGFVAEMLTRHGVIVLVSTISPYRDVRDELRAHSSNFHEVYVNAPLSVCEGRDVKGLYRRARRGEIPQFTGIGDPYEPPLSPDVECRTDLESIADGASRIVASIEARLSPKVAEMAA